jgi:hypothetical protein
MKNLVFWMELNTPIKILAFCISSFQSSWHFAFCIPWETKHSLNGFEGRKINHARGLRQGDPLSPYLFIIAIDTLQRVLELATLDGAISPLRGRNAKLKISLYADDAVIFLKPIRNDVQALFSILDGFRKATGLKLNMAKCTVAPIRCGNLQLDYILEPFLGQRASFPITYLGLPLTLGRLKVVHVQRAVDQTRNKLAG